MVVPLEEPEERVAETAKKVPKPKPEVVKPPVSMPFPVFMNVFSRADAMFFPEARCSVNPDMR